MIEYTARITSQDTPRVGGRNLLVGERFSKETTPSKEIWIGKIISIIDKNNLIGETVTWSFDLKCDKARTFSVYQLGTIWFTSYETATVEAGEWKRFSFTGVIRDEGNPTGSSARACTLVVYGGYGSGYYPITRRHKLERGTVATDWTPAPEDLDDRISTVNTSLTSLASTLLDPDEGEIHKLTAQQDQIISRQDQSDANALQQYAYFGEEISKSLRLSEDLSHALGGKASQEDLNKYVTNIVEATNKIQAQLCEMSVFGVSSSGYVDVKKRDSCPMPGTNIINGGMFSSPEYQSSQIRLTLRTDHDALKRQVDSLTAQLAQLEATTKIIPVLNADTRKRSGSTTLYPRYGDWLLTSDAEEQYISFSGLSAELGRSIYIQTRKRTYLYSSGHSFYGLPGNSTQGNRWLSNNTTYRFVRADATNWLVTASSSPYPWT